MSADETPRNRRILYGRRQGHALRAHHRGLMETLLPKIAATPEAARDPASLFGGMAKELWLEVGFGGGEHAAWQAAHRPDIGLIACEPFVNGVAKLLAQIEKDKLANVRIHGDDARDILDALPAASLSRVFVLFPDPWPKRRHWKRRFIGLDNLDRLARTMRIGAELRVASDIGEYVGWTLEHVMRDPRFRWTAEGPGDWRARGADWPATRYEEKALKAGRKPAYLKFVRVTASP